MKIMALTLAAIMLFPAAALAGGESRRQDGRSETRQEWSPPVIGWDDGATQPRKIYNWPDQRYYGQHGMMLD